MTIPVKVVNQTYCATDFVTQYFLTQILCAIHVVALQDRVVEVGGRAVGHGHLAAALVAAPAPVPAPVHVVLATCILGIQDKTGNLSENRLLGSQQTDTSVQPRNVVASF